MTNPTDDQSELMPTPVVSLHQEELKEEQQEQGEFESEAEFDDEESAEDVAVGFEEEGESGELTPNDIFGLDPLDVLTLEELADYLKISTAAVRRAVKEQNLPGRNIGGEWRFLRDGVANWLRGQEAPAQEQKKSRNEYAQAKPAYTESNQSEEASAPPRRPFQSESSEGQEYRPRQRYSDSGQQQQYGNQQYGNRGNQYRSGGYGAGGYGGGEGSYSRPPRRPFRAEGGGQGSYGAGEQENAGGSSGGYGGGQYGGGQYGGGGGGYAGGQYGGGQRFGGKRKNKRQVFSDERGRRLDRRKEGGPSEENS